MGYKVGDKFVIELEECFVGNITNGAKVLFKAKGFNSLVFDKNGLDKLQKYEETQIPYDIAYNKGLNDAWKLARKVINMNFLEFNKFFPYQRNLIDVLNSFTPQETLAKIEAYKKELKIGDVVKNSEGIKAVVVDERSENEFAIFTANGCIEFRFKEYLEKTGKHIDIQQILEQIGGVK